MRRRRNNRRNRRDDRPYLFVLESVVPSHYTDILCSSESTADHLTDSERTKMAGKKEGRKDEGERVRNEDVVMMFAHKVTDVVQRIE